VASRRDKSVGPNHWKIPWATEYLATIQTRRLTPRARFAVWLFRVQGSASPWIFAARERAVTSTACSRRQGFKPPPTLTTTKIVDRSDRPRSADLGKIERVRGRLLAMDPRGSRFRQESAMHCGFSDVCSQDSLLTAAVDVNARAGGASGSSKTLWSRCKQSAGCTPWTEGSLSCAVAFNRSQEEPCHNQSFLEGGYQ